MIFAQGGSDAHSREIAMGLATAVNAALETVSRKSAAAGAGGSAPAAAGSSPSWDAAVGVAELLDLPGLSALLAACRAHADSPPLAVANAIERLVRLVRETQVSGDPSAFARADRELAAIAGALTAQQWAESTPPGAAPAGAAGAPGSVPEAVEPLGELLSDLDVDDPSALARAVVTLPVASGLRAALDWIGADLGGPLHLELGESVLALVARATHEPGLGPAGAVLALTGGALLPAPDGRWALRVPLHASRPAFLLARQGALALAIPWHAVARLTIVDDAARSVMTEPSLSPWSPLARAEGERPAALLALGLARAWLHLDHIVWRVFARPEPVEATDNVPGGRQVVRDDGGEGYRVVEVDEALRGVPPLHTPPPRPRPHVAPSLVQPLPRAEAPAAPALRADSGAEASVLDPTFRLGALLSGPPPVAEAAPTSGGSPAPARAPLVLGPESVRPLGRAASATTPGPSARGPAPEASIPAAAAPAVRRALVVDDSLIARMELGRVLEREGWIVEWVESAAEMWGALGEGDWSAVFVDVFLPDAAGRAHLRQLVARQGLSQVPAELVALTRDSSEELLVRGTGITRVLRKPFASGAVDRVVREITGVGR